LSDILYATYPLSIMQVKVYSSAAELEQVRASWHLLQCHPNSDLDHFLLVCDLRSNILCPCVIAVWDGDQCRCIVAARRERIRVHPSIGYARLPGVNAHALTIIHGGILGTLNAEAGQQLARTLHALLKDGYADLAQISFLAEGASLWHHLHETRLRLTQHPWSTHRQLTLKPDPGFLLKKMRSKHRTWIKRKEKELNLAHPAQVSWTWHSVISNLDDLCRKMESVAHATYQRGLGAGFANDQETRSRLALAARRGQLRVFILEIGGLPKAFWLGDVYGDAFHSAATGYCPEVRPFEVGTLIFLRMIDKLSEEGVARFDFGLGDAKYKERFADHAWREATVQLFAPTLKGALLGALLGWCNRIDRALRWLAMRLGIVNTVKQLWRRRIAGKTSRREGERDDEA
jgi:hypothetical protein